ncbi:restriction endonuclease subunit S [Aliiglaciecola lipolytica]|uniref:Type I restriction enzyme, S subunit n=1 Tax=Aliiglaciecola lipolytica E3 TaxID=1127673 RepID=K6YZ95_9ALTE|nr:restriction endonuclease subunit S [Aliiglaciecola lipolytica]GAC16530.1 type I restriction enzyme, S subunit [Aliiglaciecola lipolytica E3]
MSEAKLPEGWALSILSKTISANGLISDGDWVESKDQDPNGSVRLIQLADIGDGDFRNKSQRFMTPESANALNCTFLKSGDVLIARMPEPLGRACLFPSVGQEAVTVVDICLIRTGEKAAISNKILTYWINSPVIRNLIAANASGTTRKRITRKKLEQFELPLPPLAEQKVIADKLDTLLAQLETTKARLDRIPQILKTFRQSVLAAAVSGKLTEEWRKVESYLNWNVIKLEKLIMASANGLSKRSGKDGEETTILRLADFKDAVRVYGNERTIKLNAKEVDKYSLANGDILVIRVNGSIDLAGKFIRYEKNEEIEGFCDHFIRLRLNQEKILPEYLIYVSNEGAGRQYLKSSLSTSAGQNTINQTSVKGLDVPLPPLKEQTEIVRRVEELFAFADNIEQKTNAALERVNNLTQSILAKAFRGELTAYWRAANPELISGDNSAEALLGKIKAERDTLKKQPKKKTAARKKA